MKTIIFTTFLLAMRAVAAQDLFNDLPTATALPMGILLTWEVSTLPTNSYFVIEHQDATGVWQVRHQIPIKANQTQQYRYNYFDAQANKGSHHYLIKIVDNSQALLAQKEVEVFSPFDNNIQVLNYTNTVTSCQFQMEVDVLQDGQVRFEVYNAYQEPIYLRQEYLVNGINRLELMFYDIPQGLYFVRLIFGNEIEEITVHYDVHAPSSSSMLMADEMMLFDQD